MTALITAAMAMGMLSSFHCVGMCGPLALSLPLSSNSLWQKFYGSFLYNAGRIVTYSIIGLLIGSAGKTFSLFGYQQWLSILLGVVIITAVVLPLKFKFFRQQKNNVLVKTLQYLRNSVARLLTKKGYTSLFTIGLLNGLLPCGMVYIAGAAAAATGDIKSATLFMGFFGAGTLPVMWSIAFFGNYIGILWRQKIRKAYPYMMLAVACLLILRGLGLGIPYISPEVRSGVHVIENCH